MVLRHRSDEILDHHSGRVLRIVKTIVGGPSISYNGHGWRQSSGLIALSPYPTGFTSYRCSSPRGYAHSANKPSHSDLPQQRKKNPLPHYDLTNSAAPRSFLRRIRPHPPLRTAATGLRAIDRASDRCCSFCEIKVHQTLRAAAQPLRPPAARNTQNRSTPLTMPSELPCPGRSSIELGLLLTDPQYLFGGRACAPKLLLTNAARP